MFWGGFSDTSILRFETRFRDLKCEILKLNFPFFLLIWGERLGGGAMLINIQARYCNGNEAPLSFFISFFVNDCKVI